MPNAAKVARKPTRAVKVGVGRPRSNGAQRVYEELRSRILSLQAPAETDLNELELVEEFKVSRTPVREALIRLSSEGLILLPPNKPPRISAINVEMAPRILEALDLAQRATTRFAAIRGGGDALDEMRAACSEFAQSARVQNYTQMSEVNRTFHLIIGRAADNPFVQTWNESLLNASVRLARLCFAHAPLQGDTYIQYYEEADAQHRSMLKAIEKRDADKAEDIARLHTDVFRDRLARYIAETRSREVAVSSTKEGRQVPAGQRGRLRGSSGK